MHYSIIGTTGKGIFFSPSFQYLLTVLVVHLILTLSCYVYSKALQIRLADGNDQNGRLEVYANGQWGTVCDDGFRFHEAAVACRQLGFANAKTVYNTDKYGPGTGPIWLDNLLCYGNETNLLNCAYKKLGIHDCIHAEDVGIGCFPGKRNCIPFFMIIILTDCNL